MAALMKGAANVSMKVEDLAEFQFPLPPLDVQNEIVAAVDGFQRVIDGARAVVSNYRPNIPAHQDWPLVALGDTNTFRIESGGTPRSDTAEYWGGSIPWATLADLPSSDFVSDVIATQRTITELGLAQSSASLLPPNSVLVSTRATVGRIGINRVPMATNQGFKNVVIIDTGRATPEYVAFALTELVPTMDAWATGGTFKELSKSKFSELQIPLPSLDVQHSIVADIQAERSLVAANHSLIAGFETKIQTVLDPMWAEDDSVSA